MKMLQNCITNIPVCKKKYKRMYILLFIHYCGKPYFVISCALQYCVLIEL